MGDIQVENEDGVVPEPLPTRTDNNNTKKFMDAKFYNAAVKGDVDVLKDKKDELHRLLTPCENTILHIHILGRTPKMESTEFLEWAVDVCPSLVFQANIKGETPLHLAARCGDHKVVKVLIERAKSVDAVESGYKQHMLWVTNEEKDTALHKAVRMNHIDVVRLLIDEDREHSYSANFAGETPLYMAVRRGYNDIASNILWSCTSLTHKGPRGTTTLHAAVFEQNYDMTRELLEETGCTLTSEVDDEGWTPLHYSARKGSFKIFLALLKKDKSAAYIPSKKEQGTALHVAIRYRHFRMTWMLIEQCPDSAEVVDRRGWNAFHHAAEAGCRMTLRFLLESRVLGIQLINDKNNKGNTPLHHVASTPRGYNISDVILKEPVVDKNALNKEIQTPLDLLPSEDNDLVAKVLELISNKVQLRNVMQKNGCQESVASKIIEGYNEERLEPEEDKKKREAKFAEMREEHLVVATLIATVTFAAGFTLPGGYISDKGPYQGLPILSRKVAFQAFIVSDAIAMALSTCAVFIHLFMASELARRTKKLNLLPSNAFHLTVVAMAAMVIAFATGTYAVLDHSRLLAISIVIISTFFFSYYVGRKIRLLLEDIFHLIIIKYYTKF